MKKTIFVILLILVICLGAAFAYHMFDLKDNNHLEKATTKDTLPKEDEPYKHEDEVKSDYVGETGKEIELKNDQYIVASGYAGASDNVYYTRNGVLYHFIISTEQTTRLAEGVEEIESDMDSLKAKKGKNFKIIEEDDYVVYVD